MRHVGTEHDPVFTDQLERLAQVLVFFADDVNVAAAEDLAGFGLRVAEAGIVFKDALPHAPIRVHDMREPRQPFDACFGKSEAQARKALGDSCAHDGEKSHQQRCPVRERNRHEKILEQSGERGAFKTYVNINGHVQSLRFRPERVELAAIEELVARHAMNLGRCRAERFHATQLVQSFIDLRQPEHGVPPEPAGALLADFMNPGVVGAAQGILKFDVGRESGVQQRGIDGLRVDAESIEIPDSRLHIGQFLAADRKGFFPGVARRGRCAEQRQSFAARARHHGAVDEPERILSQKSGLIFECDGNRSPPGKFFLQMFPRLRRLFYVGIRIERHQSSSPETKILLKCYRPEVKSATVQINRRDLNNPLFFAFER